jgi:hypothetical protein
VASGRRQAHASRELRAERAQLEMQLVVARVAAAAAVASEASAQMSLEAARQSAEDRATATQTTAAAAATERDSLASRLDLAEAEVEKLRATASSAEVAAERARPPQLQPKLLLGTLPKLPLVKRRRSSRRCRSWSVTWVCPRQTWRRPTANFPRSQTNSRWSPRRQRGCVRATPSCRRTSRVSHVVAFFPHFARCSFLIVF